MFNPKATFKYTNDKGEESFYRYVGLATGAGRDQDLHGTVLVVYQSVDTGQLFHRSQENFTAKMALICNHDVVLGHSGTGRAFCADCSEPL